MANSLQTGRSGRCANLVFEIILGNGGVGFVDAAIGGDGELARLEDG